MVAQVRRGFRLQTLPMSFACCHTGQPGQQPPRASEQQQPREKEVEASSDGAALSALPVVATKDDSLKQLSRAEQAKARAAARFNKHLERVKQEKEGDSTSPPLSPPLSSPLSPETPEILQSFVSPEGELSPVSQKVATSQVETRPSLRLETSPVESPVGLCIKEEGGSAEVSPGVVSERWWLAEPSSRDVTPNGIASRCSSISRASRCSSPFKADELAAEIAAIEAEYVKLRNFIASGGSLGTDDDAAAMASVEQSVAEMRAHIHD